MSNFPTIALTSDAQGRPTCLSTDVALHFEKKHLHVLRDIDRIKKALPDTFTESNFGLSEYIDPTGRKLRAYRLTRDAFSLLVMGFTGSAALCWKLRYIEAFNAMEHQLSQRHRTDAFLAGMRASAQHLAGDERFRLADCALALLAEGFTQQEAGELLRVSRHTIYRLKKRFSFLAAPRMVQGVLA